MSGFTDLPDLAARSLGGGVVAANDEFFAARDNLITDAPPVFAAGTFGAKGQVYDGWETRRRREPGDDWAILRLGAPGIVSGVVVDTSYFVGNYPPYASVEACGLAGYPGPAELVDADWVPLVLRAPLRGDSRNLFEVDDPHRYTHVRLRIYPDGGVARLRVHGVVVPDPALFPDGQLDLAALEHGGLVVGCSDMFYGAPRQLISPGLARSMGEGWETARRRDDGNDWVRVRLAAPGQVRQVELDTSHFKGNAPAAATLRGIDTRTADPADEASWFEILPRTRLQPDTRHRFPVDAVPTATEVRLDVFPDGGLARLRLPGRIAPVDLNRLRRRWSESLPAAHARQVTGGGSRPAGAWWP
ncbi:allantoicase [Plantactinospora endophytica]|uniref:Probable allantoicase n=1 Tax=Plantactinospora endophytica TaxID=673535 RepID=A0ABQ4ED49_9ACTN|nr:allantoicase [Plantactinospora endophytica]GIG92631.1 putative allantoicase [Plantactinospora endophytica]